ncbi:hypothetical protein DENSPDRAFT_59684 [Dentipellis sp. KUC8613]|nr:hypothetical protein DENSPDRAFT_59684 [Dentipellis sp. KUC8613]
MCLGGGRAHTGGVAAHGVDSVAFLFGGTVAVPGRAFLDRAHLYGQYTLCGAYRIITKNIR